MSVSCECCVLSGRGLCDQPITRPEESYRLWSVFMCDLRNIMNQEALAHWGLLCKKKKLTSVTKGDPLVSCRTQIWCNGSVNCMTASPPSSTRTAIHSRCPDSVIDRKCNTFAAGWAGQEVQLSLRVSTERRMGK